MEQLMNKYEYERKKRKLKRGKIRFNHAEGTMSASMFIPDYRYNQLKVLMEHIFKTCMGKTGSEMLELLLNAPGLDDIETALCAFQLGEAMGEQKGTHPMVLPPADPNDMAYA